MLEVPAGARQPIRSGRFGLSPIFGQCDCIMSDNNGNGDFPPNSTDATALLAKSLLPYGQWLEEAQKGIVVKAIEEAAKNGLPGEHHFYLTFRSDAPGVLMPAFLKARYPDIITIVLQHQYSSLHILPQSKNTGDPVISVGLSFSGVPATLSIPTSALVSFADPAVPLEFHFSGQQTAAPAKPLPDPEPALPNGEGGSKKVVKLDLFRRKDKNPPPEDPKRGA